MEVFCLSQNGSQLPGGTSDATRNSRSVVSPFLGPRWPLFHAPCGHLASRSAPIAVSEHISLPPALCDFRFTPTMGKLCRKGAIPPLIRSGIAPFRLVLPNRRRGTYSTENQRFTGIRVRIFTHTIFSIDLIHRHLGATPIWDGHAARIADERILGSERAD